MNCRNYTTLVLFVCLLLPLACAKTLHRYQPQETLPKIIYIENDAQFLKTQHEIPLERQMYTEVRMADGDLETGRVLRITEEDLILSTGYYYAVVDDTSRIRIENEKVIPKEDILIMRVW